MNSETKSEQNGSFDDDLRHEESEQKKEEISIHTPNQPNNFTEHEENQTTVINNVELQAIDGDEVKMQSDATVDEGGTQILTIVGWHIDEEEDVSVCDQSIVHYDEDEKEDVDDNDDQSIVKSSVTKPIRSHSESNNNTDNNENQILSRIVDGYHGCNYNDEDEIKHDPHAIISSHRSNAQIFTDTDTTPAFDYWFVLYVSLLFLSVGYIIYIFTAIGWIVLLFSAVGFIVSATYEYIQFSKAKQPDDVDGTQYQLLSDKKPKKHDLNHIFDYVWDKDEHEFGIYVSTEFTKDYIEEVEENEGKKKHERRVNVTGATRVYHRTKNGVLVVEKRALYIFDDYQGYEMIGGTFSFTGFATTIAAALSKMGFKALTDNAGDWWIAMSTLIFITIVCACFGCIVEIELRKRSKLLPPNKTLFSTSTSIPLHEIICVDKYSLQYHQNLRSDLEKTGKIGLVVLKFMIVWFKALLGVFKLFIYFYKALYVNAAFVLFVMIFVLVFLLFELALHKESSPLPNLSVAIMIMLWISFVIGAFSVHYTLKLWDLKRVDRGTQSCLFVLFGVSTILICIAAILMTGVVGNLHDLTSIGPSLGSSDHLKPSYRLINTIVCYSEDEAQSDEDMSANLTTTNEPITTTDFTNGTFSTTYATGDVDDESYMDGALCDDDNKWLVSLTLLIVCIVWYLTLIASYRWYKHDTCIGDSDPDTEFTAKLTEYSAVRIGLKTNKFFWRGSSRDIIIELDKPRAQELQEYLNDNVPWFSTRAGDKVETVHNYRLQ